MTTQEKGPHRGNGEGPKESKSTENEANVKRDGEEVHNRSRAEEQAKPWTPTVGSINLARVLDGLADKRLWVAWSWSLEKDRKTGKEEWKKPPFDPISHRPVSVSDPGSDEARAADIRAPGSWRTLAEVRGFGDGVGIILNEETGLIVVDIDGVRNERTGEVPSPWVRAVIERSNTYVEVSPSGTGFRLIFRGTYGKVPGGRCDLPDYDRFCFKPPRAKEWIKNRPDAELWVEHKPNVELFTDKNAYVTLTERHVAGTPTLPSDNIAPLLELSAFIHEGADQGRQQGGTDKAFKTTLEELVDALGYLHKDHYMGGKGEQSWLTIGMALHKAERDGDVGKGEGFDAWVGWSRTFREDCTDATFRAKWSSFSDGGKGTLVTIRSIFYWAGQNGRKPPKRGKGNGRNEPDHTYAFNVVNAAAVQPAHQEWLWPGRIPMGALTLLVALPGEGKSHVFVDIAARYTTGRVMPNGENEAVVFQLPPGRVVIFCTEDSIKRTLVPRLMAAGADLAKVDFIQYLRNEKGEERGLDITQDVPRLTTYLQQHPDARLVIFDPISESLGTRIDSHNNTAVRAACGQLVRMLGEHNIAGIGVSHLPKTKSGSIKTAAIGSIAFSALARSQLWVTDELDTETDPETGARRTEPTGRKLLFLSKANLAPDDRCKPLAFTIGEHELKLPDSDVPLVTSRIGWDGEAEATSVNYWSGGSSGGGNGGGKPKAIDEAARFIREMMLDPEKSAKDKPAFRERLAEDIKEGAENAGIAAHTLRRARERLDIVPYKREGDGRFVWPVPPIWLGRQGDLPF